MIHPEKFKGTISRRRMITPSVVHLDISTEKKHAFRAGQFAQMSFTKDGEEYKKPYSIASAPWEEALSFCIKRVEGGRVSTAIHELKEGDSVELLSPLGVLTLPEEGFGSEQEQRRQAEQSKHGNYVFITVGTGIAPFRGMIRQLFRKTLSGKGSDTSAQTTLLFGTKTRETLLYEDEFKDLQSRQPDDKFSYLVTLSREDDENYLSGHVQDHFDKLTLTSSTLVYICGLTVMVKEVKEELLKRGVSNSNIHEEHYG